MGWNDDIGFGEDESVEEEAEVQASNDTPDEEAEYITNEMEGKVEQSRVDDVVQGQEGIRDESEPVNQPQEAVAEEEVNEFGDVGFGDEKEEEFDSKAATTTGQYDGYEMEKPPSRRRAFDSEYRHDTMNYLFNEHEPGEEINMGASAESAVGGSILLGRPAIGVATGVAKSLSFASRVVQSMFGADVNEPGTLHALLDDVIYDLGKLRDRGMTKRGAGNQRDYTGGAGELGIGVVGLAKLQALKRLGNMAGSAGRFGETAGKVGKGVEKSIKNNPAIANIAGGAAVGSFYSGQEYAPKEGEKYSVARAKKAAYQGAWMGVAGATVGQMLGATWRAGKWLWKQKGKWVSSPEKLVKKSIISGEGKAANEAAEKKFIEILRDPKYESKVRGVYRTVAEKVAAAERKLNMPFLPALQAIVKQGSPEKLGRTGREGLNQIMRRKAVRGIAKTKKALDDLVKARRTATDPLYDKAYGRGIELSAKFQDRIKELVPLKVAFAESKKMAAAEQILRGKPIGLTERLHFAKIKLDEMLTKTDKVGNLALSKSQRDQVRRARAFLLSYLRKANPQYKIASDKFEKMSRNIEQMRSGQKLLAKFIDPLHVEERGVAFAKEMTRMKEHVEYGKTEWERLKPKTQNLMENIFNDLHVNAEMHLQAGEAMFEAGLKAAPSKFMPPGIFKPIISAARSWANSISGSINARGLKQLGSLMQNPEQLAELMSKSPAERKAAAQLMYKWITTPGVIFTAQKKADLSSDENGSSVGWTTSN